MKYTKRALRGNLSLSNAGQLSIFAIGTGSAFSKKLYQNNLLIIKGNTHILIDCGTRAPEAFHRLGLPITEVRNFLITHSHADHIGGLEEVVLMNRYVTRNKPSIIITREYQNILWNQSMRGGAEMNEVHAGIPLNFEDYWSVHRPRALPGFSRETHQIKFEAIKLVLFRTKHYPDNSTSWKDSAYSIGCIINDRILFTGDTRFDSELITEYCARFPIELILHDVQFFPGGIHSPFDDLKALPAEIKAKTLLMHYPDTFQTHEQKVLDAGFRGFLEQHHFYDMPESK